MAATQTSIKPDRKAGHQVAGIVAIQLKELKFPRNFSARV
jgi:hypothetical protein